MSFEYTDHCYNVGDTVTMKAVYKGSGSVLGVQWYYSGRTGANMIVDVSNCDIFGGVPDGYPERSRMSFDCQAATKTYTLSLTGLKKDELEDSWGATILILGLSPPPIVQSTLSECESKCILKTYYIASVLMVKQSLSTVLLPNM